MDVLKVLHRLSALRKIAKGQAGTPEGDNAAFHAIAWKKKHGLEVGEEATETKVELFVCEQYWEREILIHIGHTLELDVYKLKTGEIRLTGMAIVVEEAKYLYKFHRDIFERIVSFSLLGYLFSAIPEGLERMEQSSSEPSGTHPQKEEPMPKGFSKEDLQNPRPEDVAIMQAVAKVGMEKSRPLWENLKIKRGEG